MKNQYRRLSHSVWLCTYHIVFCPKYRYKVLDGKAEVIVRDRGIGFEPALTDAIFDGYRTPEASQIADGQGIGLRLSRRLARQAGGRLWAASAPGRETSFHLELPLADDDPGDSHA